MKSNLLTYKMVSDMVDELMKRNIRPNIVYFTLENLDEEN
jgi:hypothetical protein